MSNYFRITAYEKNHNIGMILDSNGAFEKKWQFSAFVISKGCEIINITDEDSMIDINIGKANYDDYKFTLMANIVGRPEKITHDYNGQSYDAIKVGDKIYIPNK